MKKNLKKLFIIMLLLLPLCLISGCDLTNLIDDISNTTNEENTGDESLEIDEEVAITNLKKLGEIDGYEIVYEFQDGDTVGKSLMGRKGDIVWCLTSESLDGDYDEGFALVKDENKFHMYNYTADDGFVFAATYEEELAESLETTYSIGYNYWLYFGFAYNGLYKKDGTSTICGRKCDKYVYEFNVLIASYKMKYIVYADQELGITLKLDAEASSADEKASLKYEVKKFNTGSKVSVPSLPDPVLEGGE